MEGGGAERQLAYLSEALVERGVEVHVGLLRGGVNLVRLERAGATIHELDARSNYDPRLMFRLVRLIHALEPDVVQTWLLQMDVMGGIAARLTGARWIVSERSNGNFYPRDYRTALRRWIGHAADAVVANSKGGLDFWTGSRATKTVIANSVAVAEIDQVDPFEVPLGGSPLILSAGRFDREKNLPALIDALAHVVRGRDAVAMICGHGPLEAFARDRIRANGLSDRILLPGYSDALWGLMKRAAVFVTVSAFEGNPNVVLEAAACRCPLVVSDIAAHREFLDEKSAMFAESFEPAVIARAIESVLDQPDLARQRAARARSIVERWSASEVAAAYIRVYDPGHAVIRHV
jgi:glycosyltransferase involved in cell wall biosynthesis